jgi:hypothetical protein
LVVKKGPKARAALAVNKELFKKSTGDTEEKVINCDKAVIFDV